MVVECFALKGKLKYYTNLCVRESCEVVQEKYVFMILINKEIGVSLKTIQKAIQINRLIRFDTIQMRYFQSE